jgi:hypothetical protein
MRGRASPVVARRQSAIGSFRANAKPAPAIPCSWLEGYPDCRSCRDNHFCQILATKIKILMRLINIDEADL